MAVSSDTRKRWAWLTGLRGLLMLIGGIYAVAAPGIVLTALVIVGGIYLVVDGVLGLWSLTFGGAKSGNFWFDVVRNVLALISGIFILVSPFLATLLSAAFLIYLVAIQAIIVGMMEIVVVLRERESYARIWPVLLNGIVYVLFGVLLVLAPLFSALVLIMLSGVLMIIFAVGLFGLAWRMYRRASASASASASA